MPLFIHLLYSFNAYKCPRLWDEGLNLVVPNMIVHLSPVINYWTVDWTIKSKVRKDDEDFSQEKQGIISSIIVIVILQLLLWFC